MSVNDYWEALRGAVQRTVEAGRIGRPVALRLTVHLGGGAASEAEECRAALRAMAAGWFGSEPVGVHRIGGDGAPSVEALRWTGGQSALLAVSAGRPGPASPTGGNLALMGSNGTLYHEIGGAAADIGVALGPPEPAAGGGKARYGVVAVGGNRTHLEGYARTFAADPRCELKAVADQPGLPEYREGLNRLLAAELEIPYLPLEQALALDGVDIAINCADVERREPVARAILEAGKHLYADKPLAGTREAAREIAAAAAAAGVTTQMFTQVWSDWGQRARAAIDQGVTGRVQALHCDMLMAKGRPGTAPPGARRERPGDGRFTFVAAKRELFDMGVYPIALVQWLSGRRVAEVYAMTGNYFFAEHAALDIEDYGALALRLDDGRVASICCGRIGATSHPRMGEQRITRDRRAWHLHVLRRQSAARGVQRPAAVHGTAGASVRSDADVVLVAARHPAGGPRTAGCRWPPCGDSRTCRRVPGLHRPGTAAAGDRRRRRAPRGRDPGRLRVGAQWQAGCPAPPMRKPVVGSLPWPACSPPRPPARRAKLRP